MKTKTNISATELAAAVSLRLSVLLRGGMTTNKALELLSNESGQITEVINRITARVAEGESIAQAFAAEPEPPWRVLAAAIEVSRRSGAPLAYACERLSRAFLKLDSLHKKRNVILSAPKATVILVASLPPVTMLLSEALGIPVLQEIVSARGVLLLALGSILMLIGVYWASAMIRQVARHDTVAGVELDLLWIALAGAKSPRQALLLVADSADLLAAEWVPLNRLTNNSVAKKIFSTAEKSGAPVRPLLSAEADAERERVQALLEEEAEKLAIKVLIPLGICVLPAFVILGVVPMLVAMLG